MKRLLVLFIILIECSCSKENSPSNLHEPEIIGQPTTEEPGNENNGESGSNSEEIVVFNISGIEGFNYENHRIASPFEVGSIGSDKTFKKPEQISNNPILILNEEDEVIFGYYPETIENQEIEIDDILLFFIANHPEIGLYSKSVKEIQEILATQDISYMNSLVKESLKQNFNPIENDKFLEGLNTIVAPKILENFERNRISEMNIKSQKQTTEDYFEVKFKRYGVFEIPNQAPIYASLGVGFYDIDENIVEYKILRSKSLIFTPGSYAQKVFDEILEYFNPNQNIIRDDGSTEHAWTHDGKMEVQISNGRHGVESMIALTNKTAEHNSKMAGSILLGYIIPEALFSSDASICFETFKEKMHTQSKNFSGKLLSAIGNGSLSTSFILEQLENESKFLSDLILDIECYNVFMKTYFALMIKYALKSLTLLEYFDTLESLSQFFLLNMDFSNSIIHEKQTLIYDEENKVLFSPKTEYLIPENYTLTGETGDEITFDFNFLEVLKKYEVNSNTSGVEFIPEEYKVSFIDVPFKVNNISGDAELMNSTNPVLTNQEGNLILDFLVGETDSKYEIVPDFKYFNFRKNVTIKLENTEVENPDLIEKLIGNCVPTPLNRGLYCNHGAELQNLLWNRNICFNDDGTVIIPECMGDNPLTCNDSGTWILNDNNLIIKYAREIINSETGYNSNSIVFKFEGQYNSELSQFEGNYYYRLKNHVETHGYTCEETKEANIEL